MRKKKDFRPTSLDGLESRIAPSSLGTLSADISKTAHHYEHEVKTEYHAKLEEHHGEHHKHERK